MKKIIYSLLLAFTSLIAGAQITCNASFNSSQSQSNTGFVNFTNTSTANQFNQYVYSWNFGDGQSGVSSGWNGNISHTYTIAGSFMVTLKMEIFDSVTSNLLCTSYDYDTVVIGSITTVTASSSALQTASGSTTINFQGSGTKTSSLPSYSTYLWNFGDGNGSTSQNPAHTYTSSGQFNASLTHEVRDSATNIILAKATVNKLVRPGSVDSCGVSIYVYPYSNQLRASFSAYGSASSFQGVPFPKNYLWDFGDGNSSRARNIVHTYAQSGTYTIACYMDSYDSITQTVFCRDTAYATVTVAYNPPPACKASYYIDTASSGGSNLIIYNNSTPAQSNPNYVVSYGWSFGDGDTSILPFPTHTYANPGAYVVCLRVSARDTNNLFCTDYYCDTIGIDSLGNVIYKNASTGFTLNVLDPTVSNVEHELAEVQLYPNPAKDVLNIEGLQQSTIWNLISLTGATVANGYLTSGEKTIKLSSVPDGLYILNLQSGDGFKNIKVQVKH